MPVLSHLPAPLPPTITFRSYHETVIQLQLIQNLPLPISDYKECDYQLQVSKGGKQLDSLPKKQTHSVPLAESKLKWSTVKRVPVSVPNSTTLRRFRLVGTYNVVEKCAFRCRIRYANKGWSVWSRVSAVQIPVESGLPHQCGRPIAFARTKTSLELKWPAPRREILEYYLELAVARSQDNIPIYDMEDEVREEDLPVVEGDHDDEEDDEDAQAAARITGSSSSTSNPIRTAQRKVKRLDWIAASHYCPTDNEIVLYHLQPTEYYRFRVKARNRCGWSPFR